MTDSPLIRPARLEGGCRGLDIRVPAFGEQNSLRQGIVDSPGGLSSKLTSLRGRMSRAYLVAKTRRRGQDMSN